MNKLSFHNRPLANKPAKRDTWEVVTQVVEQPGCVKESVEKHASNAIRRLFASLIVRQIRISQSKDAPKLVNVNDALLDCDVNLSELSLINKQEIYAKEKQAKAADRELRAARKARTTEKKPSPDCGSPKFDCGLPKLDCGLLLSDCQIIEGGK